MLGVPSPYLIGAAILAFGLATGGAYLKGRSDGHAIGAAAGVTATMDQLEQRGKINEAVRKTGECSLIIELGGVCDDSAD